MATLAEVIFAFFFLLSLLFRLALDGQNAIVDGNIDVVRVKTGERSLNLQAVITLGNVKG